MIDYETNLLHCNTHLVAETKTTPDDTRQMADKY
jgi:hypothetical protein